MNNDATRHLARDAFLFPLPEPSAIGRLPVDARHTLYWEECGNRDGPPVMFLHGGPGGGCCRTTGASSIRTTGGSCCSTSAARAARRQRERDRQHHLDARRRPGEAPRPPRHRRFVLFGVPGRDARHRLRRDLPAALRRARAPRRVLATPREIDWFMHGMGRIFPEAWHGLYAFLPDEERDDVLASYYRRLTHDDPRSTCPRPTRGTATRPPARRCCPASRPDRSTPTTRQRWRSPASRRTTSFTTRSSTTASCSRTCIASATCPARSCTAATTSSARSKLPTSSHRRGRRPSTSSCPMPPLGPRAGDRRELVAAVERMKDRRLR